MTAHQKEAGGRGRAGKQRGGPQDGRFKIALLNDLLTAQYAVDVQAGVARAAEECDVNLFCIAGGVLEDRREFAAQSNVLFDLVSGESVDGALIVCSSVGTAAGPAALSAFCERFKPLPLVSIGLAMEGIPSAFVDNYTGMHEAVAHLIEVHSRRRIAFIRGPESHQEAELRYKAYTDALIEHDIPVDPELVLPGDFLSPAVREAIALLVDDRKADFDALVAANDVMALTAMEVLHERGIRIPYDVAVAGFDDYREGWSATPPLTSVRQPLRETTLRAMELLLALIAGEEVPLETELPTELVIRQSCGCVDPAVVGAALALPSLAREAGESFEEALGARRADVVAEIAQAVESSLTGQGQTTASEQIERWLDAFVSELGGESQGVYLMVLDEILRGVVVEGGDATRWQAVLSAQRRAISPLIADAEKLSRAENLWQQARVLIAEVAQRAEIRRATLRELEAGTLRRMNQSLTTTVEIGDLVEVLARDLPRVGIERFYLALYEGEEAPSLQSRLILALEEEGRVELDPGGLLFPSRQLIPSGMYPEGRRWTMAVGALHFREEQLGFGVFEMGPRGGTLFEVLRGQISGALKGTLLAEERQQLLVHLQDRAVRLQTAAEVSRAASSILDLEELMQQVVDLVRERFVLYHVGLFLVDQTGERTGEAGRWAVLRAATGEAGRELLSQEFKLEVGGGSMTGWCIANEQARVALDAGADELRLENPLLPETRSEMALPLKVGERVLGALNVQSDRPAAFGDDDVTVLQTVADQLAVAIENARAVAGMWRLNEDLQQTLQKQQQLLETIRQLSTPVMPLLEGVVQLPLVGHIDSNRAQQIVEQLLVGVQKHRARIAIVDITGVPVVDTAVANSLLQAARATSLLGAEVVLVGIRGDVAQTIVALGVNLSDLVTTTDLQSGIEYALDRLGKSTVR